MLGQPVPRVEDHRLLTGGGRFTDDEHFPGEAWCVFVRSPHAHARIASVDTAGARAAPGVIAVLTGADYVADGLKPINHVPNPLHLHDIKQRAFEAPKHWPHWPLPADAARHVGEPVALVIAETWQQARDAAERVEVVYEPLPSEERVCLDAGFGDGEAVRAAFARASHIVEHDFSSQRIANCQMEPRSAIGLFDDGATLITGSQGALLLKQQLSEVLGSDRVRVISRDVGGAFGPRTYLQPEQVAVVWAARRLRRPVRWTSERAEAFISDLQGRDSAAHGALALDSEGRILAYRVRVRADLGAHPVSFVPMSNFRNTLTTVYRVPAAHVQIRMATSNSVPVVAYRGAGRPEAHHIIERLLDMAARRLDLAPAEIRRRNLVRKSDLPYNTPFGLTFDSGDFQGYMERALAMLPPRESRRKRGLGIANYVESPVGAPKERVELAVNEGRVAMVIGTQSSGQGHETSFAQVVAHALGVPMDRIALRTGDTEFVKAGGGTHSDRSMRYAGNLLMTAAARIIELGKARAADALEVQADDLVFEAGAYRVAGTDRVIGLLDLGPLAASEEIAGRMPAYPAGCAVCEVEVDEETGRCEITRYATVDDVGQAVNPMIVHGQVHGGIAQGVGQALMEAMVFDAAGQVLTGSWMDYAIARAENLPSFDCALAEDPTARNPLRIKGGGEGGTVPASAAVINALCNALEVDDIPMPATPEQIWKALNSR